MLGWRRKAGRVSPPEAALCFVPRLQSEGDCTARHVEGSVQIPVNSK